MSPLQQQETAEEWKTLGNALFDQEDYKDAIAAYEKAVALDPKYAAAWYNLGNARSELDDHKGAIAAYEKVVTLDPKDTEAWYNLGNTRSDLGDFKGNVIKLRDCSIHVPRSSGNLCHHLDSFFRA